MVALLDAVVKVSQTPFIPIRQLQEKEEAAEEEATEENEKGREAVVEAEGGAAPLLALRGLRRHIPLHDLVDDPALSEDVEVVVEDGQEGRSLGEGVGERLGVVGLGDVHDLAVLVLGIRDDGKVVVVERELFVEGYHANEVVLGVGVALNTGADPLAPGAEPGRIG